jgi:hypothetical protein
MSHKISFRQDSSQPPWMLGSAFRDLNLNGAMWLKKVERKMWTVYMKYLSMREWFLAILCTTLSTSEGSKFAEP